MSTTKYILLFLSMLVVTFSGDFILDNWHYKEGDHRRLQEEINKKFHRADRIFEKLQLNNFTQDTPIPKSKGIFMVVYHNDRLKYWSGNTLNFTQLSENDLAGKRFGFISNGWYVIKPYLNDSIRAYALVLVKSQYPYENEFLQNTFQPDLKLPASTELITEAQPGSYAVLDWEGIYLFSIKFSVNELRFSHVEKYLSPAMMLVTLFCLLLLINQLISRIARAKIRNWAVLSLPFFLAGLRWVQYKYHVPYDLYELEMFGPIPFAKSAWLPSLGDVFMNSLLILFVGIQFYLRFKLLPLTGSKNRRRNMIVLSIMITIIAAFFYYTHYILSNLILNSTITFEFYKAATLNIYTIIGLIIAAMHFSVLLLLANKLLLFCPATCNFKMLMGVFTGITTFIYLMLYLAGLNYDFISHLVFIAMFVAMAVMKYRNIPLGNYTNMALMVIFFSAFSVFLFTHYAKIKMKNSMDVMAENLATQHDPVAEYLLRDISKRLSLDVTLKRYLLNRMPEDQIFNHLQSNYFNGFWGKYKILFQICYPHDDIYFTDSIPVTHSNCYDFYSDMLSKGSMRLPQTNFYYLDGQNGQINYLGWFTYKRQDSTQEFSFFIELTSRLVSEELGFPELLLDRKYQKTKLLEEYSYASYHRNQLVAQSGTFQYSLDLNTYKSKPLKFEGYNHLIYYINKDNAVMVSKPAPTFFDELVSFSYVFIFYYILVLLFVTIRNFSSWGEGFTFNFKNRIQFSIIAVLFLSLILVGGGTIYFSIKQYQRKQHDLLSEKIQSVYVELDHLLAYLPNRISPNWKGDDYDNLNQLLIKFSDVFYSDINLYDPTGDLLATSRSALFDEGILGRKMDPTAYNKMVREKQAEFIHRENIGKLNFLSAYVPFVNSKNKLLAYLNLPYFTKQNILRNDVTTLIVAILNVYVLLILVAIAMAALISDQITRPLRMIQQKFSQIKIGKKSEEIVYKGQDEIAGLVDEYNRMVKELGRSLEMLARSERESAWREMAKQVAHEIKNPLTPMKLSVQHLQRSWNDNRENFDEYLEKVTRTLIEQIDNLSFIASEFSNFAKMPKAYNEEIDIVDKIRSTLTLFSNTENIDFVFEHESEQIFVFADKEQLSRVFINLIKNAIQAIPDNRSGKIGISLVLNQKMVRISITDNGKGIPEALQNKLFTPSFTTKSSGMGLGLSIVKSIIESFGGNITFKTKVNNGTTFLIELPLYDRNEI